MEGNITYILLKTKKALSWGISFKCMIMETNWTNQSTRLDIFSLPPIPSIFPLQSWSHHERTHNIIPHHWTHFIILLKCYKSTDVIQLEPQTMKISHYIFIFIFKLLNIFYFFIIVLLYLYYYATGMLSAHQYYTAEATNHIKNKVMLYG